MTELVICSLVAVGAWACVLRKYWCGWRKAMAIAAITAWIIAFVAAMTFAITRPDPVGAVVCIVAVAGIVTATFEWCATSVERLL